MSAVPAGTNVATPQPQPFAARLSLTGLLSSPPPSQPRPAPLTWSAALIEETDNLHGDVADDSVSVSITADDGDAVFLCGCDRAENEQPHHGREDGAPNPGERLSNRRRRIV